MKRLILAGASSSARVLLGYLKSDPRYSVAGFTVDDQYLPPDAVFLGLPVVGLSTIGERFPSQDCAVLMAVGYSNLNRGRESLFQRLKEAGYTIETYVHPDAGIYTDKPIGEGSVVLPYSVVEPNASVGDNTFIGCNITLAHDCEVGDHCWIASGATVSGEARVLRNSFVGINATVVNRVTVAEYNVIGAGALITKSTKPDTVHLARSSEALRYSAADYVKHFGF